MRGRAAAVSMVFAAAVSLTACTSQQSDPFVDLAAEDGVVPTVGGAAGDPAPTVPPAAVPPDTGPVVPPGAPATTEVARPVPAGTEPDGAADLDRATEAFGATWFSALSCLGDPAMCDPATVAVPGGPAHERFARLVAVFHDNGYVARHVPDVSRWEVESVDPGATADRLVAVVCDVDGDMVVEPGSENELGLDLIVNDLVVARRVRVELRADAAGWRRWSVEQLGEWPMESTCAVS